MNRVALISGGARGIGRAVALALAGDGWAVDFAYRSNEAAAESTRREIEALGSPAAASPCDVSDPTAATAWTSDAERRWGRIDALINCAGPYHRLPLLEESVEGWRAMFDNNLHPVFFLAKAVAPGMQARRWGRIITFAMANADQMVGQTQVTAHYIAKAGVLILTRSLARVLAPDGITVNAISPGFIDSGSAPEAELERMRKRIPAGHVGSVDDAVATVRFLLSEEARYLNGTNIHVSGAWGV